MTAPQPEETLDSILMQWMTAKGLQALRQSDIDEFIKQWADHINTYINKVADEIIGPDEELMHCPSKPCTRNFLRAEQRKRKDSFTRKGKVMGITSRCTECGAESTGTGGIVHATTCSAVTLAPKFNYGQQAPAIELKFSSKAEQKAFTRNLAKGSVLVAADNQSQYEPLKSAQPTPPEADRQKLVDILKQLQLDSMNGVDLDAPPNENVEYLTIKLQWAEVQIETLLNSAIETEKKLWIAQATAAQGLINIGVKEEFDKRLNSALIKQKIEDYAHWATSLAETIGYIQPLGHSSSYFQKQLKYVEAEIKELERQLKGIIYSAKSAWKYRRD